jgi:hypothetical protein
MAMHLGIVIGYQIAKIAISALNNKWKKKSLILGKDKDFKNSSGRFENDCHLVKNIVKIWKSFCSIVVLSFIEIAAKISDI